MSIRSETARASAYSLRNTVPGAGASWGFRRSCNWMARRLFRLARPFIRKTRSKALRPRVIPIRAYRTGHALEGAVYQFAHQKPCRVHRARHGRSPVRNLLEAHAAVIGLVPNQHDEAMAFGLRLIQRALHQRMRDAASPER